MKKPGQPIGIRKSLRLQNKSPMSHAVRPHPNQSPSSSLAIDYHSTRAKRKRLRDTEAEAEKPRGERATIRGRRDACHSLKPSEEKLLKDAEANVKLDEPENPSEQTQEPPLLSEKDSRALKLLYDEVMTSASSKPPKWTSSHRSTIPSETGTNQTQRSSSTNAVYRHKNLSAVEIRFHAKLSDSMEPIVKGIVDAEISECRRAELRIIAQEFHDSCLSNVRPRTGEDDFIHPLHTAIKALRIGSLRVREKAPWRRELKPVVRQQSHFSSSFMATIHQLEVDDTATPPSKRHHQSTNNTYLSPEISQTMPTPTIDQPWESSMIPPPVPVRQKEEDQSPVKTPRPNLSIGIDLHALINNLSSLAFTKARAARLIEWLQNEMVQHESNGRFEPMLLSVPAPRALDLTFPFAVVEGKAYSTRKQIFEAENQAAVSMACAQNILSSLGRIADPGTKPKLQPHVLYSITTQGPIHELWIHWTASEEGVQVFESQLWDSWNGLVLEQAEEFIVKLNNVCIWGTGTFMQSVVQSLRKVAMQAET